MPKTENEWIELFRWFHRHPETGDQEYETTEKIRRVLQEEDIETCQCDLKTGVVAVVNGAKPGRTLCLRADIDALPVTEEADVPYRSEHPGRMHACGHDFHITTGLYTASWLQRHREQLCGKVYVVFQPAEEIIVGSREVIATGLVDGVEEFYGFHAEPSLEAGRISIEPGGVMAAVDRFEIRIKGTGCHAAAPHLGNNPIPVMAAVIEQIQASAARGVNPLQPRVVSVTHAAAGETWNVIPAQALIEGTVRSMDPQERSRLRQNIDRITRACGEMADMEAEIFWYTGHAAVINDAELCEAAREVCRRSGLELAHLEPAMLGDDFSQYAESVKGARALYMKVGTGIGPSLHSPLFRADPAAIRPAAEFIGELLLERGRK